MSSMSYNIPAYSPRGLHAPGSLASQPKHFWVTTKEPGVLKWVKADIGPDYTAETQPDSFSGGDTRWVKKQVLRPRTPIAIVHPETNEELPFSRAHRAQGAQPAPDGPTEGHSLSTQKSLLALIAVPSADKLKAREAKLARMLKAGAKRLGRTRCLQVIGQALAIMGKRSIVERALASSRLPPLAYVSHGPAWPECFHTMMTALKRRAASSRQHPVARPAQQDLAVPVSQLHHPLPCSAAVRRPPPGFGGRRFSPSFSPRPSGASVGTTSPPSTPPSSPSLGSPFPSSTPPAPPPCSSFLSPAPPVNLWQGVDQCLVHDVTTQGGAVAGQSQVHLNGPAGLLQVDVAVNTETAATAPLAAKLAAVRGQSSRKGVVEAMLRHNLLSLEQFQLLDRIYLAAGPSILDSRCGRQLVVASNSWTPMEALFMPELRHGSVVVPRRTMLFFALVLPQPQPGFEEV